MEGSRDSLARVAAYIDLNPIRARLTEDPKDLPFVRGYHPKRSGKCLPRRESWDGRIMSGVGGGTLRMER